MKNSSGDTKKEKQGKENEIIKHKEYALIGKSISFKEMNSGKETMKFLKSDVFLFVIFIIAFAWTRTPVVAAEKASNLDTIARVNNIRYGANKNGTRIVIELSGKCDYNVYSIRDSSQIYVDIFDAQIPSEFRMPAKPADPNIDFIGIRQHNFRQVQMMIDLKHGLPIDNVSIFALEKPDRIVIDLFRDYNNFIQFHITKNIVWLQIERAMGGKYTLINEIYVNQKSPDVNIAVEMAKNNGNATERIDAMVKRTGAVVGVNGGFFGGGKSLGIVVVDGKIVSSHVKKRPPRTAFAITENKEIQFDRVIEKNGKLVTTLGKTWNSVKTALGAGPRLISGSRIHITAKEEGFAKGGNDITRRTGRTALGLTEDGKLGLFTFSSFRDNHRDGMKLEELASYLKKRKIVEAMNLDGGGSTAMAIMGYTVSKPPGQGAYQRPVANGIMVYDNSPIISPFHIGTDPKEIVMPADGETELILKVLVCDRNENPVPDKTPVSVSSGVGLFEKKYYYTKNGMVDIRVRSVRAPGNYCIKLECGPLQKFIPLKLTEGDPANLFARSRPYLGYLRYLRDITPFNSWSRKNGNESRDEKNEKKKKNGIYDSNWIESDIGMNAIATQKNAPEKNGGKAAKNGIGKNGINGKNTINGEKNKQYREIPIPGKKKFILEALVRDAYKNPLKGKAVKFEVAQGRGEFSSLTAITRYNGVAITTFTMDSDTAKIMVSANGLEPVSIDLK